MITADENLYCSVIWLRLERGVTGSMAFCYQRLKGKETQWNVDYTQQLSCWSM